MLHCIGTKSLQPRTFFRCWHATWQVHHLIFWLVQSRFGVSSCSPHWAKFSHAFGFLQHQNWCLWWKLALQTAKHCIFLQMELFEMKLFLNNQCQFEWWGDELLQRGVGKHEAFFRWSPGENCWCISWTECVKQQVVTVLIQQQISFFLKLSSEEKDETKKLQCVRAQVKSGFMREQAPVFDHAFANRATYGLDRIELIWLVDYSHSDSSIDWLFFLHSSLYGLIDDYSIDASFDIHSFIRDFHALKIRARDGLIHEEFQKYVQIYCVRWQYWLLYLVSRLLLASHTGNNTLLEVQ